MCCVCSEPSWAQAFFSPTFLLLLCALCYKKYLRFPRLIIFPPQSLPDVCTCVCMYVRRQEYVSIKALCYMKLKTLSLCHLLLTIWSKGKDYISSLVLSTFNFNHLPFLCFPFRLLLLFIFSLLSSPLLLTVLSSLYTPWTPSPFNGHGLV